jgi:hypothetical protein
MDLLRGTIRNALLQRTTEAGVIGLRSHKPMTVLSATLSWPTSWSASPHHLPTHANDHVISQSPAGRFDASLLGRVAQCQAQQAAVLWFERDDVLPAGEHDPADPVRENVPDSISASSRFVACAYRKLKPGRSGDGVRLGWGTI